MSDETYESPMAAVLAARLEFICEKGVDHPWKLEAVWSQKWQQHVWLTGCPEPCPVCDLTDEALD